MGRDLLGRPTAPTVRPGARLGDRFVVVGSLGRGAMGLVVEAKDEHTGRSVALKLILAHRDTPKLRVRLQREAELTARVAHPGVLTIHGVGEHEGAPFLIYELVPEARTLADALPELGLEARLQILAQVADAVGAAHAVGVVHRDLKPENVLLDEQTQPLVADFGLALDLGGGRLTQTGALLGSPSYMAPEQVLGKRDRVGPATDVWALGVMLFELATDSLPFEGESLAALAARICADERPTFRSRGVGPAPALEAVARRALSADAGDRFADGAAFAAALREAQRPGPPARKLLVGTTLASLVVCCALLALGLTGRPDGGAPREVGELPAEAPREVAEALGEPQEPPPVDPEPLAAPLALPWEQTFAGALGTVFLDEARLVVAMRKRLVHVDLRDGTVLHEVPLPGSLEGFQGRALRFKRKVLIADAGWRSLTPAVSLLLKVGAAGLGPTGDRLAYSTGSVAFVSKFGVDMTKAQKFLHVAKVQRLALSSSHLVVCSRKAVSWWDVATGEKVGFLDPLDAVDVALDPRSQTVLVGDDAGQVMTFDLATAESLQLFLPRDGSSAARKQSEKIATFFSSHGDRVAQVGYLYGGDRLFSIARGTARPLSAVLWGRDGTPLWQSRRRDGGYAQFAVSPRETHVALTSAKTGIVRVLRLPPR